MTSELIPICRHLYGFATGHIPQEIYDILKDADHMNTDQFGSIAYSDATRRSPVVDAGLLAEGVLKELRSAAQPLTRTSLRSRLQVNNSRLGDALNELAEAAGYRTMSVESFRSMRSSAQQGGEHELAESLVVLTSPTAR